MTALYRATTHRQTADIRTPLPWTQLELTPAALKGSPTHGPRSAAMRGRNCPMGCRLRRLWALTSVML